MKGAMGEFEWRPRPEPPIQSRAPRAGGGEEGDAAAAAAAADADSRECSWGRGSCLLMLPARVQVVGVVS